MLILGFTDTISDWLLSFAMSMTIKLLMWIKPLLSLIFELANTTFFKQDAIKDVTNRIYIILGILMIFKIAVACIQFLISPDKADDKENGFGGIAKRTLISVALLAFVPTIFEYAISLQKPILEAIPAILLGAEQNEGLVDDVSEQIAYITLRSFFDYNTINSNSKICNDGSIESKYNTTDNVLNNVSEIVSNRTCQGERRYSFDWLLCIACAIFLIFIFISMAVDVGIRVIKFSLLQILAPIPIASYIDPKSSKKSFDAWKGQCISVYTDLFIRVFIIYLCLYMMLVVFVQNGTTIWGDSSNSTLIKVAIVVSIFMFAKQAPKFICDVLGIKSDGAGFGEMFKRAAGWGRTPLGMGRAGIASLINDRNKAKASGEKFNKIKALKNAAASAKSAGWAGLKSSFAGKSFKETGQAMRAAADRNYGIRQELASKGVSHKDYYKELLNRRMGIQSNVETMSANAKAAKDASDKSKAALDYVHNNMSEKFTTVLFDDNELDNNDKLREFEFSAGEGDSAIKISGTDMGTTGYGYRRAIKQLEKIVANEKGAYSTQEVTLAQGKLSQLKSFSFAAGTGNAAVRMDETSITNGAVDLNKLKTIATSTAKKPGETDGYTAQEIVDAQNKLSELNSFSFAAGTGDDKVEIKTGNLLAGHNMAVAGVMEQLKIVRENKNNEYDGQEVARAIGGLDQLSGMVDPYVVARTRDTERLVNVINDDKSSETDKNAAREELKKITDVGFSSSINSAFSNIIQVAEDACMSHTGDTAFGKQVLEEGFKQHILYKDEKDGLTKIMPGKTGAWLVLNKGKGQTAQVESSRQTQASSLAAKNIVDTYDNKK